MVRAEERDKVEAEVILLLSWLFCSFPFSSQVKDYFLWSVSYFVFHNSMLFPDIFNFVPY
jgi:hypothetical protein